MNAESRRLRPVEINLEKTILTWQECFYDTVALAVRLRLQALQFFIYFLPFKIVFCVNNKINVMYFSALPSDAACDFYLVAVSAYESFYLVCCFFGIFQGEFCEYRNFAFWKERGLLFHHLHFFRL